MTEHKLEGARLEDAARELANDIWCAACSCSGQLWHCDKGLWPKLIQRSREFILDCAKLAEEEASKQESTK